MKKFIQFFTLLFWFSISLCAQENPLWLRYPSISPDGKNIAFCYKGDIYSAPVNGGRALQLTTNQAYDYQPIWSHNGKTIAFASDRNGNYDIFTMPSGGGSPKRITYNSAYETPVSFSPDDSLIFFLANILAPENFSQFRNIFPQTYTVRSNGGRPILFSPICMQDLSCMGNRIVYHDNKSFENKWRKHHTSSVTRDVWLYDIKKGNFTKITDFAGEDRNPVFSPYDTNIIYYLSEKNGTFNIYKRSLLNGNETRLTNFSGNPVRFLSISNNGLLCFGYDGEIYTLKEGSQPVKLSINIVTDATEPEYKIDFMHDNISDMSVSPDGKEIAFIIRGDVYVTSADHKTTNRITDTPDQERDLSFSPDGRSLAYSSERNGCWNIYQSSLKNKSDKLFTYTSNVNIEEKQLTNNNGNVCFQPTYSLDGKEIAYLENRTTLKVLNLESGKSRTILDGQYNYSYADGDQWYKWSPDGKWFAVTFFEKNGYFHNDICVVKSDGSGEMHNLTQSGYTDYNPKWEFEGKAIMWYSDKNGLRSHGGGDSESDVYIMFFDNKEYEHFKMNKDQLAFYDATHETDKKDTVDKKVTDNKKDKEKDTTKIKLPEITYNFTNVEDRVVRMTINSSNLGDCFLNKEGNKLYYFSSFDKGYDLWMHDFKEGSTKMVAKLGTSSTFLASDSKKDNVFMLSNGTISKLNLSDGSTKPVEINAEYTYRPSEEREYIFNHVWQQVKDKFYDPAIHNIDWESYKKTYSKFLPYINNNYDFTEMLSEMLGELNASHTGSGYTKNNDGDRTAVLCLFYDNSYNGDGLKISDIMDNNPVFQSDSKVKKGTIIEKIDGNIIKAGEDYYRFLNHKINQPVTLSLFDGKKNRWEEQVIAVSNGTQSELLYKMWVKQREKLVDSLSNGKIGYIHVRAMDGNSYRNTYSELLGKFNNKEAVIIDTRYNGGGWLHDDLAQLLNGKKYAELAPRGQVVAAEPMTRWYKPSAVIISEGNYSDAHGFPFTYKTLGIGKLIGMPVAGTMTAVWWETQIDNSIYFGIPQMGFKDLSGKYLENQELEPDIEINNDPKSMIEGRDLQIEKAVEVLLNSNK